MADFPSHLISRILFKSRIFLSYRISWICGFHSPSQTPQLIIYSKLFFISRVRFGKQFFIHLYDLLFSHLVYRLGELIFRIHMIIFTSQFVSGEFIFSDDILDFLNISPAQDITTSLLPHTAIIWGLWETEVIIADRRGSHSTFHTFLE